MKYLFSIVFIIFSSIVFNSCNSDDTTQTENGFFLGGNVLLMTEHGTPISDRSGIKVFIEGTNYTTLTDQSGNWKIYNVPAGIYNIVAEKAGFGYNKFINFEYLGNATSNNFGQTLIAMPTYLIDSLSLNQTNQDIFLTIYLPNTANNLKVVLICMGKKEPFIDSIQTWEYFRETQIYAGNNSITENFPIGFFINEGFNHGDTLNFAIYPGASLVEKYFLPSASKMIYTSGVGSTPKRFVYIFP